MLSLALWSTIAILVQTDVVRFGAHVSSSLPRRGIALYAWAVVALNAMVWLKGAVPAVVSSDPLSIMAGTGLTTNVVYVQDLAFWFPLMTVAAAWLWQGRPWGALLVGSVLTTWLIECIGVATDQWFGHRADPSSSMAAPEMVVVFAVLALVGTVPLVFYYRNINPTGTTSPTGD